jgi:hypothetical protein
MLMCAALDAAVREWLQKSGVASSKAARSVWQIGKRERTTF